MTGQPKRWNLEELAADVRMAKATFRSERLALPLALWKSTFRTHRQLVRALFRELDLRNPKQTRSAQVVDLYEKRLGDVIRYLAAPPISTDDLKVLAESSLSISALRRSPREARNVLRTIQQSLDPFRFPWVKAGRKPSPGEWKTAIVATASLMTAQRVATSRRNSGKDDQENLVKAYLSETLGLTQVAPRKIHTLHDAPAAGEFCGESEVAGRKADIVVPLFDGRLLLIECKVSNSALNSVKRVNNDAAAKADKWIEKLGSSQVVPAAMLTGVFKARNLDQAQSKKLSIFWAHRLDDLGAFILSTKPVDLAKKTPHH